MASCLTSRLGAVRYLEEVLVPRLVERGVAIEPRTGWSLPEFTQCVIDAEAVDALMENEFPPACLENIRPCVERMRERSGALWSDAFEQVLRTLVTAKLYLDAQDEGEIAKKMAAIQRLAKTLESYFTDDGIEDFVGGIREALASIPRYTRDPLLTYMACHFFEEHRSLDAVDVDAIIDSAEEAEQGGERQPPFLAHLFAGSEAAFEADVARIAESGAR